MNKDIIVKKYELITSDDYLQVKTYQLENIVKLANTDINPLILQGMLKLIADTDKWKNEFINERKRSENDK